MLISEQYRCPNEKRNFSAEFKRESAQLVLDQNYTVADAASAMDVGLYNDAMGESNYVMNDRAKYLKPLLLPRNRLKYVS
jgi:hypothetical protein